jgi:hypothetical protein
MRRPDKIRTESTFSSNKQVKINNGYQTWKRDGKIKDISIALYDVDYAIKWHLENIINPTITEENAVITVPVIFAAGEKYAAIQKHGYLRDNQGKLLTPLISIKRTGMSKREDVQDLKVLETPDARITFERKYSKENRYNRFALSGVPPVTEYYSMDVPKFVQIDYELMMWTNNTTQLNEIVEQLIWFDGKAFGDTYKFITHIEAPSFDSINTTGEDRLIRATTQLRTKAYILNTHGPNAPALYKLNPANRIVIGMEIDTAIEPAAILPGLTKTIPAPRRVTAGQQSGTSVNQALLYVNTNKQLLGTFVNSTQVTFAAGWLDAPAPLPATNVSNFIFYVNGQYIEPAAITSFTQSGNVSTLTIDVNELGFSFSNTDEIIAIGKFN